MQTNCFICEQESLYGASECSGHQGLSRRCSGRRCSAHHGACAYCLKLDSVESDEKDFCRQCASKQFLCVVCCILHKDTDGLEMVKRPASVNSKRCRAHTGWCAACMEYSVDSECNDLVCAACKFHGYGPRWSVADVDTNILKSSNSLCSDYEGCRCQFCAARIGLTRYNLTLPSPPAIFRIDLESLAAAPEIVQRLLIPQYTCAS